MIEVRTGNTLTSHSPEAVKLYSEAIDLILGSESGAVRALDKALELDDSFALAAAARYFVEKDNQGIKANDYRARAKELALTATEWEREHIDILFGLIEDADHSLDKAQAYIKRTPGDLFVISQVCSYLIFYGGPNKLNAVLELLESVEPALSQDWAYLARLGFAASEAGDRQRARGLIEQALNMRPQSLYSIHALAHLLHDEGVAKESTQILRHWLEDYEESARGGQMYGHVQWHLALAEWQTGERQAALNRYEAYCAPQTTTSGTVLALADCGGFLLRDYLARGQTISLNAATLAHIEKVWPMVGHPFVALHVAGLYASAGDIDGLKRCYEAVSASAMKSAIALSLVSALTDYVSGNYLQAAQTLKAISAAERVGIGGSNVERILIDLLEESAIARQSLH